MVKRILALLVSVVTFFTMWNLVWNTVPAPADESDFTPVLRFTVVSDTHIRAIGDKCTRRIQRAMTLAYNDADRDDRYSRVDAALFVGDLTDKGTLGQYLGFKAAVDSVVRPETEFLAVVAAASHDGRAMGRKALSFYGDLTSKTPDFHTVIGGYHFIGVSASADENCLYDASQRDWMRAQLAEAAADDPAKPIFVIHHEHVQDTVYGSKDEDGWGVGHFRDIFCEYPQVIHFSGHSHYPSNDPRSIWQGEFTAVGTGALYYAELTVDGENQVHPDHSDDIDQIWIVEVNADNEVRLRGFDALAGEKQCEYTLHNVADPNAREFTPAQQQSRAAAPAFPADAAIRLQNGRRGKYTVSAPAAESTDGTVVFLYRLAVLGADGAERSSDVLVNDYWLAHDYETVQFTVEAQPGDTIRLIAENAYGMQSRPLTAVVSK